MKIYDVFTEIMLGELTDIEDQTLINKLLEVNPQVSQDILDKIKLKVKDKNLTNALFIDENEYLTDTLATMFIYEQA